MKQEQDYVKDIAEIRSMMERSSKFLSLSGWAGVMAGIYALVGAYIAHVFLKFRPTDVIYSASEFSPDDLLMVFGLAATVLALSIGTAVFLSYRRAAKLKEPFWNATSRRLLVNTIVPMATGGLLILIFVSKGLIGLLAPATLLFYGLALYGAGNYTFKELRYLGMLQTTLGLVSCFFIEYSVLLWAIGFGVLHIIYGIYIHIKHQR